MWYKCHLGCACWQFSSGLLGPLLVLCLFDHQLLRQECWAISTLLLLLFSHSVVSDYFATPWTVTCQDPLSMGLPRQKYWSELPFPSPGDLPDPGIEPASLALESIFFTTDPPGNNLSIVFLLSISFCFMYFKALFLVTSFLSLSLFFFFCLSLGYLHMILGFHLDVFLGSTRFLFVNQDPQHIFSCEATKRVILRPSFPVSTNSPFTVSLHWLNMLSFSDGPVISYLSTLASTSA